MIEKDIKIYICNKCNSSFKTSEECIKHELTCKEPITIIRYSRYVLTDNLAQINKMIFKDVHIDKNNVYALIPNDADGYLTEKQLNFDQVQNFNNELVYIFTKNLSEKNEKTCIKKLIDYSKNIIINKKELLDRTLYLYELLPRIQLKINNIINPTDFNEDYISENNNGKLYNFEQFCKDLLKGDDPSIWKDLKLRR